MLHISNQTQKHTNNFVVMETRDHSKNGASMKSLKMSRNYLRTRKHSYFKKVSTILIAIIICCMTNIAYSQSNDVLQNELKSILAVQPYTPNITFLTNYVLKVFNPKIDDMNSYTFDLRDVKFETRNTNENEKKYDLKYALNIRCKQGDCVKRHYDDSKYCYPREPKIVDIMEAGVGITFYFADYNSAQKFIQVCNKIAEK